ncbi:hypothetical protein BGZ73_005120 [Actinomortierella ambigua]|nr:hypothetical protein BGZ73_005120 [Actinomortierella ambigua]
MDDSHPNDARDMSFDDPSIVDFDAIELEKENIQPLKSGRSALALNHLFATSHTDRANELAAGHAQFQAELNQLDSTSQGSDHQHNAQQDEENENEQDPLDVYVRYVKWIIENYPQGGQNPESGLLPLLDRAIRRFKDDEQYRNDPRLYKLFSTYTVMVEDPLDILKFMMANEIGTQLAMYYEDYADYLEQAGEQKKALEILQLGIHRGAQPVQQIKRRAEHVQRRIEEQRLLEQLRQEEQEVALCSAALGASDTNNLHAGQMQRRILGVKESASTTLSVHGNSTSRGHQSIGASSSASRPRATQASTYASSSSSSSTTPNRRPGTKLAVFVDPTGEKGEKAMSRAKTMAKSKATAAGPSTWREIGSQQVRRKENIQDPVPWKGVQYQQSSSTAKGPIAKLNVYRDEDTPSAQCIPNVVAGPAEGQEPSALGAHTTMSETERIRKHPLSNLV